jgi:hypothetical protein
MNKFVECKFCTKRFYDNGQKMKPIYLKNRHESKCEENKTKNIKKLIDDELNNMNDIDLLNILKYIRNEGNEKQIIPNIEMIIQEEPIELKEDLIQEPIELKEDEAKHSQEPIELKCDEVIWEDWEYQGEKYWVENETQDVYDRRDMLVGTRFINDIENWEINWAGIKDY